MSTKTYPSSFRIVAKSIEMVDGYETINFPHYAGSITVPTLTDNNNGTATISATSGYIFDSVDYSGTLLFGTVEEQTFTFTDGAEEYVVIDYNNGNPIMRKETNKFLINGSNIITIFIVWRQGTKIHSINQGAFGLGLSNKINRMLYNTVAYLRSVDGGLILSESSSPTARTILVTSAVVYAGSLPIQVSAFNSSTDYLTEVINTNGVWSYTNVSVYDNISYNPSTGNASKEYARITPRANIDPSTAFKVDNIFYPSLDLVSQNMSAILQLPIPFKLQEKTDMKVSAIATASGAISTMVLGWIENN